MKKRFMIYTVLGLFIVGGLTIGLFADAIQQALTVPIEMVGRNSPQQNTSTQQKKPTPALKQQQNQQGQQNRQGQQNPTLAADTFQRADQPLWGRSSDGRQWEGDANAKRAFAIVGATGQITQDDGGLNAILGTATKDVDVTLEGMVNQFGNDVNMGILVRWTDADNWYKADIDGEHLRLLKRVKGQSVTVESVNLKALANTAYMLRFRALGAMFFIKAWPSNAAEPANWQLTADDRDLTFGRVGIRVFIHPTAVINILSFKALPAMMDET